MSEEDNILNKLLKAKKPDVPKGFFENFSDDLSAKISEDEAGLHKFKKSSKPEVPSGFFDAFEQKMVTNTSNQPASKSTIIRLKVIGFASAIAASLLIMFYFLPVDEQTQTSDIEPINAAKTISEEDLLAFVDGDDILDFVLENEDINIESDIQSDEDEDIFYFLEDNIEDLYFEEL